MPLAVMIIVLFAALVHTSWNFIVKRTEDKTISMGAVVPGSIPFSLSAMAFAPLPSRESLPCLVVGAVLHMGCQLFLLATMLTIPGVGLMRLHR